MGCHPTPPRCPLFQPPTPYPLWPPPQFHLPPPSQGCAQTPTSPSSSMGRGHWRVSGGPTVGQMEPPRCVCVGGVPVMPPQPPPPDGIPFFRSANGVILTPGDGGGRLPPRYFLRVLQLRPFREHPIIWGGGWGGGDTAGFGGWEGAQCHPKCPWRPQDCPPFSPPPNPSLHDGPPLPPPPIPTTMIPF